MTELYAARFALGGVLWAAAGALAASRWAQDRPWRRLSRGEAALLAAVLALAAGLRLAASPFPSDIRSALDMGLVVGPAQHWAAGYSVLLHALFAVFPATLETACRANAVLGTLSAAALYAAAEELLEDRAAALAAAAFLAVSPIAARYSASDSAHVLATLCLLLGLAAAARWARRGEPRALAEAGAWLALAANARPEAVVFLPAAALVAFGTRGGLPRVDPRWAPLLALEAVSLAGPAAELWAARGGVTLSPHLLDNPWFRSPATPRLFAVASVAGAAVLLAGPRRRAAAGWLLAMAAVSVPAMYEPNEAWQANYRYFLPLLAMFCLPAGAGAAALARAALRGSLAAPAAAAAFAVLAAAPGLGFLTRRWTYEREFHFARAGLARIADGCTIVRRAPWVADSGLELLPSLSLQVGRAHRWMDTDRFLAAPEVPSCAVYYLSAACSAQPKASPAERADDAFRELEECRLMRERFALEPIVEALLPAAPYVNERFGRDPVPVGFYRIAGRHG